MGAAASADAVVVGGGVLGLCAAHHLRQLGAGRVVLLERAPAPGAGTTSAGAGFVAYWGGGELGAELVAYGQGFYARVQEESGRDLGVRRSGLLFPALSPAGMDFLREQERDARVVEGARLLDAGETLERAPLLSPGSVLGALHQPDAHQVSTTRVAAALAELLPRMGVEVRCGVEVERAVVTGGRVSGVETSDGTIATGLVVNAAGARARALAARNGVSVGAIPIAESRFVSEPLAELPDELPMLLFFERDLLYLRGEGDGLLVGAIERTLDGDLSGAAERHERLAHACADVVPLLGRVRAATRSTGYPTFTPDGRHVLGFAPGVEGYLVLSGCNESGVTHGPGLARFAARLALHGSAGADLSDLRVERFDGMCEDELRQGAEATYLGRHP